MTPLMPIPGGKPPRKVAKRPASSGLGPIPRLGGPRKPTPRKRK